MFHRLKDCFWFLSSLFHIHIFSYLHLPIIRVSNEFSQSESNSHGVIGRYYGKLLKVFQLENL